MIFILETVVDLISYSVVYFSQADLWEIFLSFQCTASLVFPSETICVHWKGCNLFFHPSTLMYLYFSLCPLILLSNLFCPGSHYLLLCEGSAPLETIPPISPFSSLSHFFLFSLVFSLLCLLRRKFHMISLPFSLFYISISWTELCTFVAFKFVVSFFHPHRYTLASLPGLEDITTT